MFGRKSRKTIQVTRLSSLVADNLRISGDVVFTGGLRIDGRVDGNVLSEEGEQSLVVLSQQGHVVGRVRAFDAVINGTIEGDLEVEHFLELQQGAHVSGSIRYRQLQMDCGATVDGQLVRVPDGDEMALKSLPAPATPSRPRPSGDAPPSERPATAPTRPAPTANPAAGAPSAATATTAASNGAGVRRPGAGMSTQPSGPSSSSSAPASGANPAAPSRPAPSAGRAAADASSRPAASELRGSISREASSRPASAETAGRVRDD